MLGCSSAAKDHDFGPLTITSTNRTACPSRRSRPLGTPVTGSRPATHASYASPASVPTRCTVWGRDIVLGYPVPSVR
jgi:hypothetical protein